MGGPLRCWARANPPRSSTPGLKAEQRNRWRSPRLTRLRLLNLPVKATIAVITTDVRELQRAATQAGWGRVGIRAGVDRYEKSTDDGVATVHLLTPDRARGLEFDAVVVVGTGSFSSPLELESR